MKTEALNACLNELVQLLGVAHVLRGDAPGCDLSAWEADWRGRRRGRALAVVRPACTADVAQVVRACARAGVALVPQGGNTGLVLGGTPDHSGTEVVLSLQRLNAIRQIDPDNLTLVAEAGCVLQTVQAAAADAGLLFPLSLAAQGSCTVGGNLATNAGGTQVLRHGNARDLCLGLEVVTAQGAVWDGLSGLRKDNTGYDLRHLFIGSEGTLGVITAACLKLFPAPQSRQTAWVAVPNLDAAVALLTLCQRHLGPALTGFELMGQAALALVQRHFPQLHLPPWQAAPYGVLLETSSHDDEANGRRLFEACLGEALSKGCAQDAVLAETLHQGQALWAIREHIPLAQAKEGLNVKHDISVAVSKVPGWVADVSARLLARWPGVRIVNFGHLGDGNLHFNVQAPEGEAPADFLAAHESAIHAVVYETVSRWGGSISAEHGIGALKVDTLQQHKSPVALDLMARIKTALDPLGTLNPGRVLPKSGRPPNDQRG